MSSIGSIGSTAADLLAAIRQQLLSKSGSSSGAQKPAGPGNQLDAIVGQLEGASNDSGSAAPAAASSQTTGNSSNGLSSGILSVLIVLQEQQAPGGSSAPLPPGSSGQGAVGQQLFAALDSNGDGQIGKSELESAFTAAAGSAGVTSDEATQAADALVSKLDTNGDGSVSQNELAAGAPKGHHHHHSAPSDGAGGADPLAALLQPGSADSASWTTSTSATDNSTSVTNADGSTTTTITYADGTKITLSTPAPPDSTSASPSTNASATSGNGSTTGATQSPSEKLLAALIRLQEQAFQSQSTNVASLAA